MISMIFHKDLESLGTELEAYLQVEKEREENV